MTPLKQNQTADHQFVDFFKALNKAAFTYIMKCICHTYATLWCSHWFYYNNYHNYTTNMAYHLKYVCISNFTWPLNLMLTREMCAMEVFVWWTAALTAGQIEAPVRSLAL